MFNLKTDNIEQITESAIKQANGNNPLENLPVEYLQKIKNNINNPMFIPLFKAFELNKSECANFIDNALSNKRGNKQVNNKYKKGLDQLK